MKSVYGQFDSVMAFDLMKTLMIPYAKYKNGTQDMVLPKIMLNTYL